MAKRKYNYLGDKKITSIRLSEYERMMIEKSGFKSVQSFVQHALKNIKYLAENGDKRIYAKTNHKKSLDS